MSAAKVLAEIELIEKLVSSIQEESIQEIEKGLKAFAKSIESYQYFQIKQKGEFECKIKRKERENFIKQMQILKLSLTKEGLSEGDINIIKMELEIEKKLAFNQRKIKPSVSPLFSKRTELEKSLSNEAALLIECSEEENFPLICCELALVSLVSSKFDPNLLTVVALKGFEGDLKQRRDEFLNDLPSIPHEWVAIATLNELYNNVALPKTIKVLFVSDIGVQCLLPELVQKRVNIILPLGSELSAAEHITLGYLWEKTCLELAHLTLLVPNPLSKKVLGALNTRKSKLKPKVVKQPTFFYPVEVRFEESENGFKVNSFQNVLNVIRAVPLRHLSGDIIIFLSSFDEILRICSILEQSKLASGLPIIRAADLTKELIEGKQDSTRVILLALSSNEIPLEFRRNCSVVVDSGIQDSIVFSYKYHCYVKTNVFITKHEAIRRKELTGKNCPGIVFRLYSISDFTEMREESFLELSHRNLERAQLLGIYLTGKPLTDLEFLGQESESLISNKKKSMKYLKYAGAVSDKGITDLGRALLYLPYEVPYSLALKYAANEGVFDDVSPIIATQILELDSLVYLGQADGLSNVHSEQNENFLDNLVCPPGVDSSGDLMTTSLLYSEFKESFDEASTDPWTICEGLCLVFEKVRLVQKKIEEIFFHLEQFINKLPIMKRQDSFTIIEHKQKVLGSLMKGFFPTLSTYLGRNRLGYHNHYSLNKLNGEFTCLLSLNREFPSHLVYMMLSDVLARRDNMTRKPRVRLDPDFENVYYLVANGVDIMIMKDNTPEEFQQDYKINFSKINSINLEEVVIQEIGLGMVTYLWRKYGKYIKEFEDEHQAFIEPNLHNETLTLYSAVGKTSNIKKKFENYLSSNILALENEIKELYLSNNMRICIAAGGETRKIILFQEYFSVIVSGLPNETSEKELIEYFHSGGFENVKVDLSRIKGNLSAKVTVDDAKEAEEIVEIYNSWEFKGNEISVIPYRRDDQGTLAANEESYIVKVQWYTWKSLGKGEIRFTNDIDFKEIIGQLDKEKIDGREIAIVLKDSKTISLSNMATITDEIYLQGIFNRFGHIEDIRIEKTVERERDQESKNYLIVLLEKNSDDKVRLIKYKKKDAGLRSATIKFRNILGLQYCLSNLNQDTVMGTSRIYLRPKFSYSFRISLKELDIINTKKNSDELVQNYLSNNLINLSFGVADESEDRDGKGNLLLKCHDANLFHSVKVRIWDYLTGKIMSIKGEEHCASIISEEGRRYLLSLQIKKPLLISIAQANLMKNEIDLKLVGTDDMINEAELLIEHYLKSMRRIKLPIDAKNLKKFKSNKSYVLDQLKRKHNLVLMRLNIQNRFIEIEGDEENVAQAKASLLAILKENQGQIEEIINTENVCNICYSEIIIAYRLIKCRHKFCRSCLIETIKNSFLDISNFPIRCPECSTFVVVQDLLKLVDGENLEKLGLTSLNSFVQLNPKDYVFCFTPNCSGVHRFSDNIKSKCPKCLIVYCLNCKVNYHQGMTCVQYKIRNYESLWLPDFMKNNDVRKCPNCKSLIQKGEGCFKVLCASCKMSICWKNNCMQVFKEPQQCYDHLNKEHGGYF